MFFIKKTPWICSNYTGFSSYFSNINVIEHMSMALEIATHTYVSFYTNLEIKASHEAVLKLFCMIVWGGRALNPMEMVKRVPWQLILKSDWRRNRDTEIKPRSSKNSLKWDLLGKKGRLYRVQELAGWSKQVLNRSSNAENSVEMFPPWSWAISTSKWVGSSQKIPFCPHWMRQEAQPKPSTHHNTKQWMTLVYLALLEWK